MTKERKLALFDELVAHILDTLNDPHDLRHTFNAIGFTEYEIDEIFTDANI